MKFISRRIIFIVFSILSFLLNLILIYGSIDTAITMDHQHQAFVMKDKQLETCKTILTYTYPKVGYLSFLDMLENAKFDLVKKRINDRGNEEIAVDDILFEFSKEKNLVLIDIH